MIIQELTKWNFQDAFRDAGRQDQFSIKGLNALYDFLNELYCDDNYELDVIGICCDFTEQSIEDALADYNLESVSELENQTLVVYNDGENILYQNF